MSEEFRSFMTNFIAINLGHRRNRANFSKVKAGDQVRAKLYDGRVVSGKVVAVNDLMVSVDNEEPVVGGHNVVETVTWVEIIDLEN